MRSLYFIIASISYESGILVKLMESHGTHADIGICFGGLSSARGSLLQQTLKHCSIRTYRPSELYVLLLTKHEVKMMLGCELFNSHSRQLRHRECFGQTSVYVCPDHSIHRQLPSEKLRSLFFDVIIRMPRSKQLLEPISRMYDVNMVIYHPLHVAHKPNPRQEVFT